MSKLAHGHQPTMDALDTQRAIENGDEDLLLRNNGLDLLTELQDLCKEWRELVREDLQKGWTRYADEYVHCYFAENCDHTVVRIGGFDVAFHSKPKIEFTISDWPTLPSLIAKGRALLEQERTRRAQISVEEKEAIKETRRAVLLKQLQELEAA
jgi:hypothetical protein